MAIRIYVGNLPYQVTESELAEVFKRHGSVARVELPWDDSEGRPRGFGFVEMPSDDEGAQAVAALQGHQIAGRTVVVDTAQPRNSKTHVAADHKFDPKHHAQNRPGKGGWTGRH